MDNRFGRQYRLLKTDDFSSVFALGGRRSHGLLQISQSGDNGLNRPRFGLVVGKRAAKRANTHNYMKHAIRDRLRRHKEILPLHDFVVQVHQPFMRENAADACEQLAQLMKKR